MPNSQTHLHSVTNILQQPESRTVLPWLFEGPATCAFLLGAISPDVRAISGQAREETHFFDIPFTSEQTAQASLLARWPQIKDVTTLPPPQAAFIAGYMTHLVMDQTWVEMIVLPGLFIKGVTWNTRHPNWRLYSVLMTYMEYRAAAHIPDGTLDLMAQAEPDHWLPFVRDCHLADWRDHVVDRIKRGGPKLVSAMFARSNNITSQELEAIVLSEERMAEEAYPVVPHERLIAFESEANRRSYEAVLHYLSPSKEKYF
jgi:hypothetical protein